VRVERGTQIRSVCMRDERESRSVRDSFIARWFT
jgi:hypothetical protein